MTIRSVLALLWCGCRAPEPAVVTPTSSTPGTSVPPDAADSVLVNGDIVTMDPAGTRAAALAVRDGAIVWVGDGPVPPEWIGPATGLVTGPRSPPRGRSA